MSLPLAAVSVGVAHETCMYVLVLSLAFQPSIDDLLVRPNVRLPDRRRR
jgi:hypothetical protein